jgi:catechol 2,3-dioxygenase-like lactoylglutathione lyase family enzyme
MLQLFQIALVTTDQPASLRLYSEALGYRNAGAQASWGSKIQGVDPQARSVFWWLVGDQPFFQLEIFCYAYPETRSLAADWSPADHGWVRFGVEVADFDATLAALATLGIPLITTPVSRKGRRHAAFRDPWCGPVVEVIESRTGLSGPRVAYVTSSVSDLEGARGFYGEALGLEILPLSHLHEPEDEAIWGLPGAQRDGFVVAAGGIPVEVVSYRSPAGRPKRGDHRLSDQGIMNIALGGRRADPVAEVLDRLAPLALSPPFVFRKGENICGYINDREREIEFASVPEELDSVLGFEPAPLDFMNKRLSGPD